MHLLLLINICRPLIAVAIIIAFFESQDELKDSNENHIEFATYALDKLRLLYRKADGDDKEVGLSTFPSYRNSVASIEVHL